MRQAINLEKKISAALQKLFPESLQRAFDEMDKNHDRYIDKEDLKEGIKKVLKITNVEDAEMAALIEKLNLEENEKGLDFSAFLVRFGALYLSYRSVYLSLCVYIYTIDISLYICRCVSIPIYLSLSVSFLFRYVHIYLLHVHVYMYACVRVCDTHTRMRT
jgi:hypothetical protein